MSSRIVLTKESKLNQIVGDNIYQHHLVLEKRIRAISMLFDVKDLYDFPWKSIEIDVTMG